MKVLTLKQPWATLVAEGLKKYEFRTGYAWKLSNVKKVYIDKSINGKLGLWNIDL